MRVLERHRLALQFDSVQERRIKMMGGESRGGRRGGSDYTPGGAAKSGGKGNYGDTSVSAGNKGGAVKGDAFAGRVGRDVVELPGVGDIAIESGEVDETTSDISGTPTATVQGHGAVSPITGTEPKFGPVGEVSSSAVVHHSYESEKEAALQRNADKQSLLRKLKPPLLCMPGVSVPNPEDPDKTLDSCEVIGDGKHNAFVADALRRQYLEGPGIKSNEIGGIAYNNRGCAFAWNLQLDNAKGAFQKAASTDYPQHVIKVAKSNLERLQQLIQSIEESSGN